MSQYLIYDRDKAAFMNKVNKLLKQLDPPQELGSTNFIDVPGSGTEDKTIVVTENPVEEKMIDALCKKRAFSYKVKKINLQEIVSSLK